MLLYIYIYKLTSSINYKKIARYTESQVLDIKKAHFQDVDSGEIIRNKYGKLIFTSGHLFTSITDSKYSKAVGLSKADFAIDLEKIRERNFSNVINSYFHKEELQNLESTTCKAKDFYILWTLKEAFVKFIGTSVFDIANSPNFDIANNSYKHSDDKYSFITYLLEDDYIFSIVFYGDNLSIKLKDCRIKETLYKTSNIITADIEYF